MTPEERRRRRFSTEVRKEFVAKIESGELTVQEVSRLLEVKPDNVRRWLKRFGRKPLPEMLHITTMDEVRRLQDQQKEIGKLKQIIGEQQVEMVYLREVVRIARSRLGDDFEKKA